MTAKKVKAPAKKPEAKEVRASVNYIDSLKDRSPFDLSLGDVKIKPLLQPDNSYIWPIPTFLLERAKLHTHLAHGRLVAEK